MGGNVNDREEQHGVGDLSMEPKVLIQRQPLDLGTDPSHQGAAHGDQDECAIDCKRQTSTTREPDGELERVETGQTVIGQL